MLSGALLFALPCLADTITLNESSRVWQIPLGSVSGFLFMCEGAPVASSTPCQQNVSDVIVFDGEIGEAFFFSNADDEGETGTDPADIPFTGHFPHVFNRRNVAEPGSTNGSEVLDWPDRRVPDISRVRRISSPAMILDSVPVLFPSLRQRFFWGQRC